jgi:recombinase-like zinc beta ribbon protein
MSDEVRPHSSEEVRQLVTPEVAARLNPHEEYGIQWYNRQKVAVRTISEPDDNGGRRYRNSRTFTWRPKEEWVAIPVPAYLPRTLVDRAHAVLNNNRAFERKHPSRTWELKGLMRCGCGLKMSTRTAQPKGAPRRYHYYECKRYRIYKEICSSFQKSFRAEGVEEIVWSLSLACLRSPRG